jgi:hypothetical protein
MNRAYGEPVNVRARDDGRPTRFVWRGRLYAVHAILEHWSEGPAMTAGVYELRREAATGIWTMRRGFD